MIQITPQMRILVAVEAVDGRKGIDSLARLCQERLQTDPFSGCLFVFRSRRGTAIRILVYDGQGFWLAQKRLSKGRFRWWPEGRNTREVARASPQWAEGEESASNARERTGLFTSGIVSRTRQGQRIVMFFTGTEARGGEFRPGAGATGRSWKSCTLGSTPNSRKRRRSPTRVWARRFVTAGSMGLG
jgi:hypothetical protein